MYTHINTMPPQNIPCRLRSIHKPRICISEDSTQADSQSEGWDPQAHMVAKSYTFRLIAKDPMTS